MKLHNVSDEKFGFKWFIYRDYGNSSYTFDLITKGQVIRKDGWLTVENAEFQLPDFTDVSRVYIKVEGGPPVDFLLDNVYLIV